MSAEVYMPQVEFSESCFHPLQSDSNAPAAPKKAALVSLSDDQNAAYITMKTWMSRPAGTLTLGGYAGTGKSTLTSHLAADFANKRIVFCALTGKATNVLRQKMRALGLNSPNHQVMTLHSLIYQCFQTPDGRLRWKLKDRDGFGSFDRIVIDEASMVPDKMLEQLLSFNVPILAVGDHGQLPPVGGAGSLMKHPILRLEKIHRQAEGNPILALSAAIRESGDIPMRAPEGENGEVTYLAAKDTEALARKVYKERNMRDVAFLCWKNQTRTLTNQMIRRTLGVPTPLVDANEPTVGDQVIVLKNAFRLAFNGMRGELSDVIAPAKELGGDHYRDVSVEFADERLLFEGTASRMFFGRPKMVESLEELEADGVFVEEWDELGLLLDFGYCMTTHKAQGSQFDTVAVIRERPFNVSADTYKRWAYTATTRAQNRLFVLV